jgi:hypothetical protein
MPKVSIFVLALLGLVILGALLRREDRQSLQVAIKPLRSARMVVCLPSRQTDAPPSLEAVATRETLTLDAIQSANTSGSPRTDGGHLYKKAFSLNMAKVNLNDLNYACKEAEHSFWTALHAGRGDLGVFQLRWGKLLLELKDAERAWQTCKQEFEAASNNGVFGR